MRSTSEVFKTFKAFRDGRTLKEVSNLTPGDLVPWLTRSWRHSGVLAPFSDHVTFFRDFSTKPSTRIVILQPYVESVAHQAGIPLSRDLKGALLERWSGQPLPNSSPVNFGIQAVVRAAQRKSDEFAEQYGLTVQVSFPGWYAADKVLLIEYRKKVSVNERDASGEHELVPEC